MMHDERERGEAAEDVDEVGAREREAAAERGSHAQPLDERRRNREPEQGEPDEAREDEDGDEERNRKEDEHRRRRSASAPPRAERSARSRAPPRST